MEKLNIMVVEDEVIIRQMLVGQLKQMDCSIIADVASGEEAVQIAYSDTTINLICMDINLSGSLDGVQAAEMISTRRDIPILFLTAYELPISVGRKIAHYGHIGKPIPLDKLRNFIWELSKTPF
ncbi:MAG: response regulator [Spirochaetes bacterium]|jgi:CheY-like chemotaxis protein|nr:response regulator [Spirochaetota bacterium]